MVITSVLDEDPSCIVVRGYARHHLSDEPHGQNLLAIKLEMRHYCANPKTVNTRIVCGMLLCCEEKANQMQDEKTASCNGYNFVACSLISHLIGHGTIKSKSNQSVHGFWIRTVILFARSLHC